MCTPAEARGLAFRVVIFLCFCRIPFTATGSVELSLPIFLPFVTACPDRTISGCPSDDQVRRTPILSGSSLALPSSYAPRNASRRLPASVLLRELGKSFRLLQPCDDGQREFGCAAFGARVVPSFLLL